MNRRRALMEWLQKGFTQAWKDGNFTLAEDLNHIYTLYEEMSDEEWMERHDAKV